MEKESPSIDLTKEMVGSIVERLDIEYRNEKSSIKRKRKEYENENDGYGQRYP